MWWFTETIDVLVPGLNFVNSTQDLDCEDPILNIVVL